MNIISKNSIAMVNWNALNQAQQTELLQRPVVSNNALMPKVKSIIQQVRQSGDAALKDLTLRFDQVQLEQLQVSAAELLSAEAMVKLEMQQAVKHAAQRIRQYAEKSLPQNFSLATDGIQCQRLQRPLQRVGLYVPGGSAPLVSTLLMLAIPAQVAGCKEVVLCTPPQQDGTVNSVLLWAADYCGISKVYSVGGAQAIAAMAYGTSSIAKVDKIFGPGNGWVTMAKQLVAQDPGGTSIDLLAGPSELMVIADASSNADFIAADLLSQAEHGADSQVYCVTTSQQMAAKINLAVNMQLNNLSRQQLAAAALSNSSLIVVDNIKQAIDIVNQYAPEHLSLQCVSPELIVPLINNAGAIFVGPWSAETFGDYVCGANHVLPTSGYARAHSGLAVTDFIKWISVQTVAVQGVQSCAQTAMHLAQLEGLDAHRNAVQIRLQANSTRPSSTDFRLANFVRNDLISFTGYRCAQSEVEEKQAMLCLHANEMPENETALGSQPQWNRYPQNEPLELLQLLANFYHTDAQNLMLTRGSNEGINLLLRLCCKADVDNVIICPPTYGMYAFYAQLQAVNIIEVPLIAPQYSIDIEQITQQVNCNTKIIFVCSPNNPTGNLLPLEQISGLCQAVSDSSLVVVDEAYIEFSEQASVVSLLDEIPNLVVVRTLSKALGMAALRVGVVLAHKQLIKWLKKIASPYAIAQPCIDAVSSALVGDQLEQTQLKIVQLKLQRQWLVQRLQKLSIVRTVWPSAANFVLVTFTKPVLSSCYERGVLLRDMADKIGIANTLRITVGTAKQNQVLIDLLEGLCKQNIYL